MHATQLKKEQEASAKLRTELADLARKHEAEIQTLAQDRDHHQAKVKEAQEFGQSKEKELLKARDQLIELRGRTKVWLADFNRIQSDMSRKPYLSYLFRFQQYILSPHD